MYTYEATVTRVVDGDTVDLIAKKDIGFRVITTYEGRFRLFGINAPEMKTPEGPPAKAELERLLTSRPVWNITTYKSDVFGRWLVDIHWSDTTTVNQMMIDYGWAVPYAGRV